jgi:hypothetical protein
MVTWEKPGGYDVLGNGTTTFSLKGKTMRSGDLLIEVRVYEKGNPLPQTHQVTIPITHIAFDNGHKALIFWMLYNETSTYQIGYPLPSTLSDAFLRTVPYCDNGLNTDSNEQPGRAGGWRNDDVIAISHCDPPSFARIAAHTFINGMINNERLSGLGAELAYPDTNYRGSIGNEGDDLFKSTEGCETAEGKVLGKYADLFEERDDGTVYVRTRDRADWLWDYAQCLNRRYNNTLFNAAYTFFMQEIDLAINDFRTNPTYDPSQDAFSMLAASPAEGKASFARCLGGCTEAGYNVSDPTQITQAELESKYSEFITLLKTDFRPSYPSVLRPIIRTEFSPDSIFSTNYENSVRGYAWYALTFRRAENNRHIPR